MIDEREVVALLRAATDDIAVPAVPTRDLAAAGNRRRHRRWAVASVAVATTVAAVAVAVPWALGSERPSTAAGASCVDPVPSRVLPEWARTGFSDPRPSMPYVLGDSGDIAALIFADPLTSPSAPDHGNKILWVSRVEDDSSLHITATLPDGTTATRVVDGAPGPSIIDLPKPGCWHLALRWGDHSDTMSLAYVAP
jgi:hypothetical protein